MAYLARAVKVVPSRVAASSARFFNIHEYQGKILCDKYGVAVQKWRAANTPDEAAQGAKEIGAPEIVVKAQVHAGGRGKGYFKETPDSGGGVQFGTTPDEVAKAASNMLGKHLITKQTSEGGSLTSQVMVAESVDITTEKYVSFVMDRSVGGAAAIVSPQGGMDIEAVAEESPEAMMIEPIDMATGITKEQATALAKFAEFKPEFEAEAAVQIERLYDMFIGLDATQVEINPMAETKEHGVITVDAKVNFDDNALFRQKEVFEMRDTSEEDPREVEASKWGLNYIGLDGNIACMVNGAGLAMATMDIIQLYGGTPANFLDVGGGAQENQVKEAFKILTSDKQVEGILVNIFGGIMQCDIIAQGIVNAAKEVGIDLPLVVRLEGTNVELGKKIIQESGLTIITADDLDDAAQKAVKAISA
jgi:succinyl-CoA synthetase beta subunit